MISLSSSLLLLMYALPFEKMPCPILQVEAHCQNGSWQSIMPTPENWSLTSTELNGSACTNEGEHTSNLQWNYAAYHSRYGAICKYSLLDQENNFLAHIQFKSWDYLGNGGGNWQKKSPGYYFCDEGQPECLFLKIPQ